MTEKDFFIMGNPRQKRARVVSGSGVSENRQSSGAMANCSGYYQLEHENHPAEQELLVVKGTPLPFCPSCGESIEFVLMRKIDHIDEDPDFRHET